MRERSEQEAKEAQVQAKMEALREQLGESKVRGACIPHLSLK